MNKKAFTLAEVIIVLTILGIIAMITVPSLVRHQNEVAERTKLKKIWKTYDQVIQTMTVENNLRGEDALKEFAKANNCSNSAKYFRAAKYDQDGNYCILKTHDDVWMDISDILHPVITLDKNNNKTDDNTFTMVTRYNPSTGAFLTNDVNYSGLTAIEKDNLNELLKEIENKKEEEIVEEEQLENFDDYFDKFASGEISFENLIKKTYPNATVSYLGDGCGRFMFSKYNFWDQPAYAYANPNPERRNRLGASVCIMTITENNITLKEVQCSTTILLEPITTCTFE